MRIKINSKYLYGILPSIGILVFLGLYIYSTLLYPGGSQANLDYIGFDWVNNYLCNLFNEQGMNGQINPARPIAITSMIILCFSLMLFFIQFARKQATSSFWRLVIPISGITSMLFTILLVTKYHDLMTSISSIFGAIAVIGIIWEVYKSKLNTFKLSGVLCVILLAINNYIYFSNQLIEYLPLIQKITFIIVLIWIMGLNFLLIKKRSTI